MGNNCSGRISVTSKRSQNWQQVLPVHTTDWKEPFKPLLSPMAAACNRSADILVDPPFCRFPCVCDCYRKRVLSDKNHAANKPIVSNHASGDNRILNKAFSGRKYLQTPLLLLILHYRLVLLPFSFFLSRHSVLNALHTFWTHYSY